MSLRPWESQTGTPGRVSQLTIMGVVRSPSLPQGSPAPHRQRVEARDPAAPPGYTPERSANTSRKDSFPPAHSRGLRDDRKARKPPKRHPNATDRLMSKPTWRVQATEQYAPERKATWTLWTKLLAQDRDLRGSAHRQPRTRGADVWSLRAAEGGGGEGFPPEAMKVF